MNEIPASNLPRQVIQDYAARIGEHHRAYDDRGYADIRQLVKDLGAGPLGKPRRPLADICEGSSV